MPLLVYAFARTWLDRRTAILAAVLTGVLSFNTVYASTQSSDAVCTVLFMTAVVAFARARDRGSLGWFALVGALTGLAPQFRPNLILLPLVFAAFAVARRRSLRGAAQAGVLVCCAAAVLMPWVARNYRLTRTVLPTSVHGGVQLWYGTLQVGPYLRSRAYNPRSVFESPVFDYTSLDAVPLIVEAQPMACASGRPTATSLTYWSSRDRLKRGLNPVRTTGPRYTFEIPAPGQDAVIYYYFTATWPAGRQPAVVTTPAGGERTPFVYFVSQNHLGDLDLNGDLLDIFDVVRLVRHDVWGEPVTFADRLRAAGIADAASAVDALARPFGASGARLRISAITHDGSTARVIFADGSAIGVPREWQGRITDLTFTGDAARSLMSASIRVGAVNADPTPREGPAVRCGQLEDVRVNDVFYRREPHQMGRYSALAMDNIRRNPAGFLVASAYRAVRLFVIQGTDDSQTAQQFAGSRLIYAVATLASATYLVLFAGGVIVAWRRGADLALPLALIAYVPATIAPVLTNMRYTVTVQPLIFMFIAAALTGASSWLTPAAAGAAAGSDREETRTARRL
jgi:hypothetical protein